MFEKRLDTLGRIDDLAITGKLGDGPIDPNRHSKLLHDIGWLRGALWEIPIPHDISEAMGRVIDFATGEEGFASSATHPFAADCSARRIVRPRGGADGGATNGVAAGPLAPRPVEAVIDRADSDRVG
jgi:hypothetical protein